MFGNEIREQLQDIIRGVGLEEQRDHCSTIRNLLIKGFGTSPVVKSEFESRAKLKEEQAKFLRSHSKESGNWIQNLPNSYNFLAKGGESVVYLNLPSSKVIKANDAIYYATWGEYFDSLCIHNLIFPGTSYVLLGFMNNAAGNLIAVVEQAYIEGGQADLKAIRELLTHNGFRNTKREDYFHDEFGLLLEDMHDENVIAKNDVLFFIDTVFYIM